MNLPQWLAQLLDRQLMPAWGTLPLAGADGPELDGLQVLRTSSGDKPTVTVQRRRRPTPAGPEGRERADAPDREGGGGAPPPSPPSGGGSSGGGRPSGGMPGGGRLSPIAIGALLILLLCAGPFFLFNRGGEEETPASSESVELGSLTEEQPATPAEEAAPESAAAPTEEAQPAAATNTPPAPQQAAVPVTGSDGSKWLIMLYQDADDKILEQDIFVDMNEAERVGSSDAVQIVAQLDRFQGGYRGDGDWAGTRRYYVTRDDNLDRIGSQLLGEGEVNMADAETLIDFVTWAVEKYPADKYVLILSDHGMGWPGGWSDPTASGGDGNRAPLASRLGDQLYLNELDGALTEIRQRTGIDKFELIGMDACLMGHLEVFAALAPHARYAVASQETEPALGWAYASFLDTLQRNPAMTGGDLGRAIVESYIQRDERIIDDQARAEFAGGRSPSAAQLATQLEHGITLTAVDLGQTPAVMDNLNKVVFPLQNANQRGVAQARSYAQSFTNIFGSGAPSGYIDLGHFLGLLKRAGIDSGTSAAVDELLRSMIAMIVAEKNGPGKPGATGLSIYFPTSQFYGNPLAGPQSYTVLAERFAQDSLWDEFLAFHYTGRTFEPAAAALTVPDRSQPIIAPGAGVISLSPIEASRATAAPGQPVLLSTDVSGENIGYIKLLAGFVDADSNSLYLADSDYLESSETQELSGVYYPVWPDADSFTMQFEWEPIVFAVSDGQTTAEALFTPESYGKSFEEATYTVDGTYTYADGGEQRSARLYFRNGVLQQVFGFTGSDATAAPREILPQPGDTFTVLERWLDLDANGKVVNTATEEGKTLTFGAEPFTWETLDAAVGNYVVGFIVEDLDGNSTAAYTEIEVQ